MQSFTPSGFTEALFGSKGHDANYVWQDREIRFDIAPADLQCRNGEIIIEALDDVEDTKGNNGEHGEMRITNLRLTWFSNKSRKTNISIGYNCTTSVNIKTAESRLKGQTQALYVMTKYHNQRFEFIFTSLVKSTSKVFSSIQNAYREYDNSRLYRDLKLRGGIIQDKELRMLPQEQMYSRVQGVWNLSSETGNLGTFYITSVRIVWFANLAENFNVSIPYLQIRAIKVRESKFGPALVLETTTQSGGYVLGFKIDPRETLDYVYKELQSLWQVYSTHPVFGVECTPSEDAAARALKTEQGGEDVEIVDGADRGDVLAAYYADGFKPADREPVFSQELGLAVEALRDGASLEQLWSVL